MAVADFSEGLTKGVGFKFLNNNNDYVDFRLKDGLPASPLKLGDLTLFSLPGGGNVKYQVSDSRIKEEITLNQAPAGNVVSFDFASSNLVPKKRQDGGYDLNSPSRGLIFEVSAPVVWDAEGKSGAAELIIEKGTASILIDAGFLKSAAYPIVVDPTVVAASGAGSGLKSQHNAFFDGSRYWVLYSNGIDLVAKSSTDSINWISASGIMSYGANGNEISTWYAGGNTVYVAYTSGSANYGVKVKKGTISGSNISWSASTQAFTGTGTSNYYGLSSITQDTSGHIWIAANHYDDVAGIRRARVKRSTNANDITAWPGAPTDISTTDTVWNFAPQAVALPSGDMYFAWLQGTNIKGRLFTGSSGAYGSIIDITGVSWNDDLEFVPGVVAKDGVVYLAYPGDASYTPKYRTLSSPYNSWSGAQILADDSGARDVTLSLDSLTGDIYSFYRGNDYSVYDVHQVKLGQPNRKTLASSLSDRPFAKVEVGSPGNYKDVTTATADGSYDDVVNNSGYLIDSTSSEIVISMERQVDQINFNMSTVANTGINPSAWYSTGDTWAQFPAGAFSDNTGGLTQTSNDMTFTPQFDWTKSSSGYYRLKITAGASPTVKPKGAWIRPYPRINQVIAPYSTPGDPFVVMREGRSAQKITFSTYRGAEKLGVAQTAHSHSLKTAQAGVNLVNGNLSLSIAGPSTPAGGIVPSSVLTYNSQSSEASNFGFGWVSTLSMRLIDTHTEQGVIFEAGDGARYLFDYENGAYTGPPELHMALTKSGSDFLLKTKDQITYAFASTGKLKTVKDRNNSTTTYNYDGEGKLATVVSASNTTTTLAYDESVNRVTSITDAAGRSTILSYDTSGNLTTIKDALNNTTTVGYDANHNLIGYTDARGYTTGFTYANDKVTRITDPAPLSYQTSFTYNWTSTEVDGPRTDLNDKTVYNIDPSGLLVSLIEPAQHLLSDGSQWRYRQKITLNTDSVTLTAGSDPNLPHNLHISTDTAFDQVDSSKFWQKVDGQKGMVAFTSAGGTTTLNYSIKDWDYQNKDAHFDVKNTWDADADTSIYVYYGFVSGGLYPKGPSEYASAYDSSFKAVYPMNDDPTTSTVQDKTSNNNVGSKVVAGSPGQTNGRAGKAQSFDGVDDYINIGTQSALDMSDAMTLSAWVYSNASQVSHAGIVVGRGPTGSVLADWSLEIRQNQVGFNYYNGSTWFDQYYGNVPIGAWTHIAVTRSSAGNEIKFYKNGALVQTATGIGAGGGYSNNSKTIGVDYRYGAGAYFNGLIDEVGVSNNALSGDYIKLGYEAINKQDDIGAVTSGKYIEVAGVEGVSGVTSYVYDNDFNKTSTTKPNGAATTETYDASGNRLTVTDPMGAATRYAYNSMNDIVSTTDALGYATTYSYDATGNLTKKINADNTSETYTNDQYGRRTTVTDARGFLTTYAYTSLGQVAKEIFSDNTSTTHEYDLAGNETTTTNPLGQATARQYDLLGRETTTTDPLGNAVAYVYDAVGNRQSAVNARGKTTTYFYDQLNRLWKETKPTSATTTWQYDEAGNKTAETNPRSFTTTFSYDTLNRLTKTVYGDDTSVAAQYDVVGNKIKDINQKGAETTYAFDLGGRLSVKTDALNKTTTYAYNALSKETSSTNARGATTRYGYDALGRLTVTTDALGYVTRNIYDAVGNKITAVDSRNNATIFDYDAFNRVISTTDALGYNSRTTYDAAGRKISETNQVGHRTDLFYDAAGRLIRREENNGPITYMGYDANGNNTTEAKSVEIPIADMEADEVWTGGSFDTSSAKQANQSRKLRSTGSATSTSESIALNWSTNYYPSTSTGGFQVWVYVDNAANLSTTATNDVILDSTGGNLTNYYRYSLNGLSLVTGWNLVQIPRTVFTSVGSPTFSDIKRLMFKVTAKAATTVNVSFDDAKIVAASKITATRVFDDLDRVVAETDAKGATTSYTYDAAGNKLSVTDAVYKITSYQYDALNRETTVTDPMSKTTSSGYDAAGNKISATDSKGEVTTYQYDSLGRQTKATDPLGKATTSIYDSVGNKTAEIKSDNTTVTYGFDPSNRMITTTNELGQNTTYTLDALGNQTGITPPQGAGTANVYDADNRLTTTTVAGQATTYVYDGAGNKKSETAPGNKTTIYRYNELGQTTSTVDPDAKTTSFTYDIRGNKLTQVETSLTIWYTYDELGSQIKLVDSTGRIKGETKDSKGRTTGSTDINGAVNFAYDDNDRVTSLKFTGETSNTFGYDANGARTSFTQSNLVNTAYGYDQAGKLESLQTSTTGGTKLIDYTYSYIDDANIGTETISGASQVFTYDSASQLTKWKNTSGVETTYTYDAASNRTKAGAKTFTYDTTTSQIKTMVEGTRTTTFSHNAASGNLTSRVTGTDTTTYTWTGDNRLASISSSSTSATFTYDAEGKRTSKKVNGVTTKFVYDDIKLIAEKNASGTITAKYFYDSSGQLISMNKSGQNYYFHLNHRGDVIKVTNASQNTTATYSYDPWGNILSSTGAFANSQPFRYAGYYWDIEIGMYYLINRYYDPVVGRFVSKDPVSDPEEPEANPYEYCRNNPVMGIDSNGLYWDGNPNYHRLMSIGSMGEDVRWVQRAMIAWGLGGLLAPYYADGVFGSRTFFAALTFQATRGIGVDGIVGPITWGHLVAPLYGWHVVPVNTSTRGSATPSVPAAPQPEDISQEFRIKLINTHAANRRRTLTAGTLGAANIARLAAFAVYAQSIDDKWVYTSARSSAGYLFEGNVFNGGELGNLRFGYAGAAAHISKTLLAKGGGVVQLALDSIGVRRENGDVELKKTLRNIGTWFEKPEDIAMMKVGHTKYQNEHGCSRFYYNERDLVHSALFPFAPTRIF